jgi:hypothetical protein
MVKAFLDPFKPSANQPHSAVLPKLAVAACSSLSHAIFDGGLVRMHVIIIVIIIIEAGSG